MRTLTITAVSLALLSLYACSDSDTTLSDNSGGAGESSGQAGSAARAGAAGSTTNAGALGNDAGSAGSADTAAGASEAGDGSLEAAGAAGTATNAGGAGTTSAGGTSGGASGTSGGGAGTSTSGNGGGAGHAGSDSTLGDAGSTDTDNGGRQIPVPPSGAAIDTTTSDFVVSVSWSDNSNDETGFNVYLSTDDTRPATPTATVGADVSQYDLKRVTGGMTYRAWVEAVNAAGVSSAVQVTASAVTRDLIWDDLYYDEAAGNVFLAVEDSYHLVTGSSITGSLFGYCSTSPTALGPALSLDPTFTFSAATYGMDLTDPEYFWAEARTSSGSLFSMRTLRPASGVTNLQASTDSVSGTLSWDATPGATGYEVFYGTGSIASAARLSDVTTTTARVPSLLANTLYSFWVRAKSSAIGGSTFPGPFAVAQATIVAP